MSRAFINGQSILRCNESLHRGVIPAQPTKNIEKSADLLESVEPGTEKKRRRGRRCAKRIFVAKAVCVALPHRVVVASRRVNDAQAGGDPQPESCPRRPQAPVDISQVKAVERGSV